MLLFSVDENKPSNLFIDFDSFRFQGQLVVLLISIMLEAQDKHNLISELSDVLNSNVNHFYVAPSIACGIHHLQMTHDSFKINKSEELTHVCNCLVDLFETSSSEDFLVEYVPFLSICCSAF